MRKIVKRTLAGAFTAVFALAAVGCGESGKDSSSAAPGEATQLTVFIASDKVKGTNESKVTEAVERKFEEDTGKAVKLNFLVYNKSDFASAVENSKASLFLGCGRILSRHCGRGRQPDPSGRGGGFAGLSF